MRLGISTRGLDQGSFAISTIIYHLVKSITEVAPSEIEIILYFNDPVLEGQFDKNIKKRSKKIRNRFIWDHTWLPPMLKNDCVDMVLCMKGTLPFVLPCQGAVMFHDMGYFHKSIHAYKILESVYMRMMIARASHQASRIFTISEFTKNQTCQILRVNPDKVTVIYPDCSSVFQPIKDTQAQDSIKNKYHLPDQYFFFPTSISPRKNINRILDAYAAVQNKIPHHLVITGGKSWRSTRLKHRIETDFKEYVHILGDVPKTDMAVLYSLADFTIYPSLLEGFGMPILESFRCACPVLTSNIASMPEIAGGAAYLVNPFDTQEIANGIYELATNSNLREILTHKGLERSKEFSWEYSARKLLTSLTEK